MEFLTSLVSDIGVKRKSNQDSCAVMTAETLIGNIVFGIVCDGMGGYSDGEKASAAVVKAFIEWFRHRLPFVLFNNSDPAKITDIVMKQWAVILGQCNSDIISYGLTKQIKLGTTCTCFLASEQWYCFSHIGDTRIYCISEEGEQILTEDHTVVAKAVREGRLTPEEAKTHPKRHVLTRGLGMKVNVAAQMSSWITVPGAEYIICTDGFRGTLEDGQLAEYYAGGGGISDSPALDTVARKIISDNIIRGERDNMTAVAVKIY